MLQNLQVTKEKIINFKATYWSNLINFSQSGVCKPALTKGFSNNDVLEYLKNEMILEFPDLLAILQCVEKAVK